MIRTKNDLKEVIHKEKQLYLGSKAIARRIVNSPCYYIFKYIRFLRLEEYHKNNNGFTHLLGYMYFKTRKNRLGNRMGFDIPANCIGSGLVIHHTGAISINAGARVGNNCDMAGNVCIGNNEKGVPTIGNNVKIGFGSIIIGDISIADDCIIGAGSVVTKSVLEKSSVIAGVPAKVLYVK